MDLQTYISDTSERRRLAAEVGTSPEYLWQMATGWRSRRASRVMAIAIERATNGVVTRQELRPDIFGPPVEPALPAEQLSEREVT